MSDETPRLKLAQLVSLQELNTVTWNEALAQVDALVDLVLLGQYVNTPPTSPADGDAYLLGSAPSGAWSGYAYKIASCRDGAWRFYTPFNGLRAYLAGTGVFLVYLNGVWADGSALLNSADLSIASAASCDLAAAGALFVQITGTTTITSFGSGANKLRFVRFAQALTLTHNASSLILLGGTSRQTAAGDMGLYASDANGNWRERSYHRAAFNPGDAASKTGAETLTNKTLTAPTITTPTITTPTINGTAISGVPATLGGSETLSNKTLLSPILSTGSINAATIISTFANSGYSDISVASILAPNCTNSANVMFALGKSLSGGNCFQWMYTHIADNSASNSVAFNYYGVGIILKLSSNAVAPGTDGNISSGSAAARWSTVYAATGAINTSAAASKTGSRSLAEAEIAVAKALSARIRFFRFTDAVAAKGEAARLHCGLIAEEVFAVFAEHGLDPFRYGLCCRDPVLKIEQVVGLDGQIESRSVPECDASGAPKWTLGLRYDELAVFLCAGLFASLSTLQGV